jgi:hypothetical protein
MAIFRRIAKAAGIDATGVSGDSTRVGAGQDMIALGLELPEIMQAGAGSRLRCRPGTASGCWPGGARLPSWPRLKGVPDSGSDHRRSGLNKPQHSIPNLMTRAIAPVLALTGMRGQSPKRFSS